MVCLRRGVLLTAFFSLSLVTPIPSYGELFDSGLEFSELVSAYDTEMAGKKEAVELQSFKAGMYVGFVYGVYESLINEGLVYPLESGLERSRGVMICVPPGQSFRAPLDAVARYIRTLPQKEIGAREPYAHVLSALVIANPCRKQSPKKTPR